jgi:hypothetical protein
MACPRRRFDGIDWAGLHAGTIPAPWVMFQEQFFLWTDLPPACFQGFDATY